MLASSTGWRARVRSKLFRATIRINLVLGSNFGDRQRASTAISKLIKLANPEHNGMYWALEHNTPFYGWGHAGRVESTAMAVLALASVDPTDETRHLVKFHKTEARAGEDVHCSVEAERIGSRGWGMMIAEIGLPPGADVDRRVLDEVVINSGWTVSHYDVLPDRLVLYLWPNAGGTKVTFTFHPRYGLKARTAPSVLYDYYNPEAVVALPPADFNIKSSPQEPIKTAAAK